jgi:hypothetical protein
MKEVVFQKYNLDKSASIKVVTHRDTMKFDGCGRKMSKTDEGYYSGSAPIAKVGIMAYLMADGAIVRELVPAETLFDQKSMDSLKLKPITNNHPEEKKITVDNAGYRQVGWIGEQIEKDADLFLCANLMITDAHCIGKIDEGKQELSPGYEAELVFQPGVFNNEQFDAIQVSRKYNHLAVVDNARGGTDIRMKFDGFESRPNQNNLNQEKVMKFKIDGIEYEAAQEVINLIAKKDGEIATEKASVKTANDSIQVITAERDTLKAKVDELEKRDIQKEINDAVQARLELERIAGVVLDKVDEKLDNRALKVAIITKKLPEVSKKIDEKTTDLYINAVLDSVVASFTKEENDNLANQRKVIAKIDEATETNTDSEKSARDKMLKRQQDEYKVK